MLIWLRGAASTSSKFATGVQVREVTWGTLFHGHSFYRGKVEVRFPTVDVIIMQEIGVLKLSHPLTFHIDLPAGSLGICREIAAAVGSRDKPCM